MPNYQGQNYKVNRKVKEAVDKNQVNYRESADSPISIIKRVYVYITDKKGNVLPEVTVTIDDETITTGYGGLLISNFPNEEKTITVSKEGYKTATATIILDAEKQTHKFFLALETDDDESEVISTDDSQPKEDNLNPCGTLLELSNNNTLQIWNNYKTNEISENVYTGGGSYIKEGWSNQRLWKMDFDYKYNTSQSLFSYVGLMPICPGQIIIDMPDSIIENKAMVTWEMGASLWGMESICTEGPASYKYNNVTEYHHVTIKKTDPTTIEYYFDNNKWVYSVPKLSQLDTLYFGLRDNVASRNASTKGATISVKNLKVVGLCSKADIYALNETVEPDQVYNFTSYGDENGEIEWGSGTVQIIEIPDDDEAFIKVKVLTNEPDDSFVNQVFYIQKNAKVGNDIYPLYSDNNETETGIYVSVDNQVDSTNS